MGLQFVHGDPLMVDYTPSGAAVVAGQVVNYLGKACIAHNPIADGALGALAWPNGSAVYKIEADTAFASGEDTLAAGDTLYMETADGELSDSATGAIAVGSVVTAIAAAASAPGTLVIHGG